MRCLFFTAAWRRPEITEICFMGLNRLMSLMDAKALSVISEPSMQRLCDRYGIDWVMHDNEPLGAKKNAGLDRAMTMEWDYLIELGSDDVMTNNVVEFYRQNFGKDYFGFNHVAYIDSKSGQCRAYKTDTCFGMGRALRRNVIEAVGEGVEVLAHEGLISPGRVVGKGSIGFFKKNDAECMQKAGQVTITSGVKYKLWSDHLNRSMDNDSNYKIEVRGKFKREVVDCPEPMGIDIKSDQNIWPFNPEIGRTYDMKKLMDGLSNDEQSAICQLLKRNRCETQVVR